MVRLSEASLRAIKEIRKDLDRYEKAFQVGDEGTKIVIRSFMDVALGDKLPCGISVQFAAHEICRMAAQMVADCHRPETDEQIQSQLKEELTRMEPEKAMVCMNLLRMMSSIELSEHMDSYLQQIDWTVRYQEASEKALKENWGKDSKAIARRAEREIKAFQFTQLGAALMASASKALGEGQLCQAIGQLDKSLESEYEQASRYALDACALYVAVVQGKVPGIPKQIMPQALTLMYVADAELAQVYNDEYYEKLDEYELESRKLRIQRASAKNLIHGICIFAGVVSAVATIAMSILAMEALAGVGLLVVLAIILMECTFISGLFKLDEALIEKANEAIWQKERERRILREGKTDSFDEDDYDEEVEEDYAD